MRQAPGRAIVGGLLGIVLAVGLGGCTDGGEDPGAEPMSDPSSTTSTEPIAFLAEPSGRRSCASLGGPRGSFVIWARVRVVDPVTLGDVLPTGQGALPSASLTLRTFVSPDPGPDAPDYGFSRDGVPGEPVSDPSDDEPAIGGEVDSAGREAASRAWSERQPARGVELEPGTHYLFVTIDAVKGFELGPPELAWSQDGSTGQARLPRPLFGRVRCGG